MLLYYFRQKELGSCTCANPTPSRFFGSLLVCRNSGMLTVRNPQLRHV